MRSPPLIVTFITKCGYFLRVIIGTSYEHLLNRKIIMKYNRLVILFSDRDFSINQAETRYGRLLDLDFEKGVDIRDHPRFENSDDPIQRFCLTNKTQMTCILWSGKIVVKDLNTSFDLLTIEVPEPRIRNAFSDQLSLCCEPDLIVAIRLLESGWKIHAYKNRTGALLYEINVSMYELETGTGDISVDLKGMILRLDNFYWLQQPISLSDKLIFLLFCLCQSQSLRIPYG